MEGVKKIIFIANLALVLVVFNWMIFQKEQTISNGELVLLQLYPLDPRSLMQGDYMRLRYEMTNTWSEDEKVPNRGYCILKKGDKNIATYQRLQASQTPIEKDEIAIKYYKSGWNVKIGAESFLFQEGKAEVYEKAKYGGLRVEPNGSSVLIGLYDEEGNKIMDN